MIFWKIIENFFQIYSTLKQSVIHFVTDGVGREGKIWARKQKKSYVINSSPFTVNNDLWKMIDHFFQIYSTSK